jgi:hypothetical protein
MPLRLGWRARPRRLRSRDPLPPRRGSVEEVLESEALDRRRRRAHQPGGRHLRARERGGTASLGRYVEEHFEALEADFQRFYQLDLRRCLWGAEAVGLRRLRSLIAGLPTESATKFKPPDPKAWTRDQQLLALLAELVDYGNRNFIAAHTKKGSPQPKPIKIPRPGKQEPQPVGPAAALMRLSGGAIRVSKPGKAKKKRK